MKKNNVSSDFDGFEFEESSTSQPMQQLQQEPVQQVKQKNTKKSKSTNANVEEPSEPKPIVKEDKVLYIISDRNVPGIMKFYRESGLRVARVFTSLDKARGVLLMEDRKIRVAVIDTGTGKFVSASVRKDLIDMIGVSDDDTSFTMFYTDSTLKDDIKESLITLDKHVDWVKYTGTLVVTANLLAYPENYVLNTSEIEYKDTLESQDDIMDHVGDDPGVDMSKPMVIHGFSPEQIIAGLTDPNYEQLLGYEPHI